MIIYVPRGILLVRHLLQTLSFQIQDRYLLMELLIIMALHTFDPALPQPGRRSQKSPHHLTPRMIMQMSHLQTPQLSYVSNLIYISKQLYLHYVPSSSQRTFLSNQCQPQYKFYLIQIVLVYVCCNKLLHRCYTLYYTFYKTATDRDHVYLRPLGWSWPSK